MSITQEIFDAFLKCPTKSHLYSEGAIGTQPEFGEWQRHVQEEFKEAAWARLRSSVRTNEWYMGTPPIEQLEQRRYRLISDYVVAEPNIRARLHGLELDRSKIGAADCPYIPIRFVPSESSRHATSFSLRSTLLLSRKYAARHRKSAESFMAASTHC